MKPIKFIRFWWEYNINKKEPSFLFTLVVIVIIPFLAIWVFLSVTVETCNKKENEWNKFWEKWLLERDGTK